VFTAVVVVSRAGNGSSVLLRPVRPENTNSDWDDLIFVTHTHVAVVVARVLC
jgi:hypothetical protein